MHLIPCHRDMPSGEGKNWVVGLYFGLRLAEDVENQLLDIFLGKQSCHVRSSCTDHAEHALKEAKRKHC